MVEFEKELYPYKLYLTGGIVSVVWVPFKELLNFWEFVKDLKKKDESDFHTCFIATNGDVIEVIMDAKLIAAVDTSLGTSSKILHQIQDSDVVRRMQSKNISEVTKLPTKIGTTRRKR
jgi:hypothetical protein